MTSLTDLTTEELRKTQSDLWDRLTEIAKTKLTAVAAETKALDQLMRIEVELRVRRAIFAKPNPDQKDYDEYVRDFLDGIYDLER